MGMPQIPEGTNRPSLKELLIDLYETIALDSMAISHVLNAQGEQLQLAIANYKCNSITFEDLNLINHSTHQTISELIMKEWLLLSKFTNISNFSDSVKHIIHPFDCCCTPIDKCNNDKNSNNKYNGSYKKKINYNEFK